MFSRDSLVKTPTPTNLLAKTYVFGEYGSGGGRFQFSYGPENCLFGFGKDPNYDNAITGFAYNTERHVVKYVTGEGFYLDGTKVVAKVGVDLITWGGTGRTLYLGALHGNSLNTNLIGPLRIYPCKIWENGTPKRDLVPKQRVLDGKNGLYDNVTGNFYAYYGDKADFTAFFLPPGTVLIVQ